MWPRAMLLRIRVGAPAAALRRALSSSQRPPRGVSKAEDGVEVMGKEKGALEGRSPKTAAENKTTLEKATLEKTTLEKTTLEKTTKAPHKASTKEAASKATSLPTSRQAAPSPSGAAPNDKAAQKEAAQRYAATLALPVTSFPMRRAGGDTEAQYRHARTEAIWDKVKAPVRMQAHPPARRALSLSLMVARKPCSRRERCRTLFSTTGRRTPTAHCMQVRVQCAFLAFSFKRKRALTGPAGSVFTCYRRPCAEQDSQGHCPALPDHPGPHRQVLCSEPRAALVRNLTQLLTLSFRHSFIPGWDCHGLPIEIKALERVQAAGGAGKLTPREIRRHAQQLYGRR